MNANLPEPLHLIAGPYRYNHISGAFPTERLKVCLVNLVAGGKYAGKTQPAAGVQVLAGYLRATTRAAVSIVDMQALLKDGATEAERYRLATERVIEQVRSCSADIVGLSLKWGTLQPAEEIVRALKSAPGQEGTLFALGNSLATFCSQELLQRPVFRGSVAVLGEGEDALKTIVERASQTPAALNDPQLYAGIANVKTEPVDDRAIIRARVNLDEYPLLTEANAPEMYNDIPWAQFEGSRGCQWSHCTFCSIKMLYGSPEWLAFPTPLILDRLERHIRSGVFQKTYNWFGFADSDALGMAGKMTDADFNARVARAEELAAGIKSLRAHYNSVQGSDFKIARFSVRPDALYREGEAGRNLTREKVMADLHAAGLRELYLGLESGSGRSLKLLGKGVTVETNRQALAVAEKLKLEVSPGFIFFAPDSDMEGLRANALFIEEAGMGHRDVFGSLRAQVRSPLVKKLRDQGRLGELDLDQASYRILWEKSDPAVQDVQLVFERVEGATKKLVDYLEYQSIAVWANVFRNLNGDFISWYLNKDKPETAAVWNAAEKMPGLEDLLPGMADAELVAAAPVGPPPVVAYQNIDRKGLNTGEILIASALVFKYRIMDRLLEEIAQNRLPDSEGRLRNELIPEAKKQIAEWLAELGCPAP